MAAVLLLLFGLTLTTLLFGLDEAGLFTLVQTLDELLHRDGCKEAVHIECYVELPTRFGCEDFLLLFVLV